MIRIDSGAQAHATNKEWRLINKRSTTATITTSNRTQTKAQWEGELILRTLLGREVTLKNVLYHLSFDNFISGQITDSFTIEAHDSNFTVQVEGNIQYYGIRDEKGMMWMNPGTPTNNNYIQKVTLPDLYERYGHSSYSLIKTLPEAKKVKDRNPESCKACQEGKSTKPAGQKAENPVWANRILERLHADLIVPWDKERLGKKYVLTIMDDYSRFCTAIPIWAKSDTKEALKEWVTKKETLTNQKVAAIQADWGGEFRNNKLHGWCKKKGITIKSTTAYHHKTNAIIECLNRMLQNMARTALIAANLNGLWGDAIQWAAYIKNRVPQKSLNGKSPIETLMNGAGFKKYKLDRTNLRPFGQRVMAHTYKEQRLKDRMAPRAQEARIIRYTETHGIYKILTLKGKCSESKDPQLYKPEDDTSLNLMSSPDLTSSTGSKQVSEILYTPKEPDNSRQKCS